MKSFGWNGGKMKLSIVIPYYNRKSLLLNVLKTIDKSTEDIEIIIVDDGSNKEHRLEDISINHDIKLIRLERSNIWRGPCIAYNTGFKAATGDWIMINSSECIHVGDIIGYVFANMDTEKYIAFSTYMSKQADDFRDVFNMKNTIKYDNFWGVHSSVGNCIPYCGVIAKEKMDILGGYDERFVNGIGFDDYDFTHRVINLGLKVKIIDDPFAIHQWHKETNYINTINHDLLMDLNKNYPDRIKANE